MKLEKHSKRILLDHEVLLLLERFCHEALRFMNISNELYPEFKIGVIVENDGKANPLYIDYTKSNVLVFIPVMTVLTQQFTDNDAPTYYRMLGYQIARFWNKYVTIGIKEPFNPNDEDSIIFAYALMLIKGIRLNENMPNAEAIEMLKKEFNINCMIDTAYDNRDNKHHILRLDSNMQQAETKKWASLSLENINRPLATIHEGQLGSESNPFSNVDDAAKYILEIERERLASDQYRQEVVNEQYYYDGVHFRIPWASANVSYYHINNSPHNSFIVNQLSTHNKFSLKPSLAHNKFLYRGQAEFYPRCVPSLFRDDKKDYFVDDIIQINELECLLNTHPLVKLFEQGFELLHDYFRFKIYYQGLAQHYYGKTRFLDLTSDMDVAKFFAVTTFNMTKDCYEKYTGNNLGVLYYCDLKANSFHRKKNLIESIGKQPFMRSGNQSGFLIDMDKEDNFNTFPEVRYVYFRHNSDITDRIFAQYDNGNTIMPDEILRKHWYARMNDGNALKIISTEALKRNFIINSHESHNKIIKALRAKGFKIKNYHPSFTDEELDVYYQSALEFWEEFCSNIYFYSPEGALMKEHLRNLPNDPRYRWAFYR